jgi:hypothetical protein
LAGSKRSGEHRRCRARRHHHPRDGGVTQFAREMEPRFLRGSALVREPLRRDLPAHFSPRIDAQTCARRRHDSAARTGRAHTDTGHNQRWRERPHQGALGSGGGHGGGVVHAIVGAVTSARARLDEAADSAASRSWPPQRTSLQAFACGSCSWPTRGERASGEVVETGGPT